MALSCMRCPAGVAAVRRIAAPPPSTAALSFARCSFERSAAAGWRIDAVAAKGGGLISVLVNVLVRFFLLFIYLFLFGQKLRRDPPREVGLFFS